MKPTKVSPNAESVRERESNNLCMVAKSEQITGKSGKEMPNLH